MGVTYQGIITRKRMKSMVLRADLAKRIVKVSCPLFTTDRTIDQFVIERLPILIKKLEVHEKKPESEDGIYILGEKKNLEFEDEKEKQAYLKRIAINYLKDKVPYYGNKMGIKEPYKVRVKNMKSRYGSNSRVTHTLAFSTFLFHFPPEVIDAVIVHELAHHFQMNHSPRFYRIVYTYYPDYKKYHSRLKKRQYEADHL